MRLREAGRACGARRPASVITRLQRRAHLAALTRPGGRASATGSAARGSPSGEHLGDPAREDQSLEQRVGGEPVGAVHAGAGDLAGGEQAGHDGLAVEVGGDAARRVVAGRGDRDQLGHRVDAVRSGRWRGSSGTASPRIVGAEVPGVEPHVRAALLVHPPRDRLGDHVARREVGELVLALHEAVALAVDQEGALAAHRLGDQRLLPAGVGAELHHGRVELHELQVAQHRTGPQRQRHAVAGRHRGVGGLGEHLAEPTGGEHDGAAAGPRRRRRAGPRPSRAG